jgi:hypothetical protein
MKTLQLQPTYTVQSITYTPERRVMTFSRIAPRPDFTRPPGKRRKAPFRLQLIMGPEAECSFEPTIQIRSQAKS